MCESVTHVQSGLVLFSHLFLNLQPAQQLLKSNHRHRDQPGKNGQVKNAADPITRTRDISPNQTNQKKKNTKANQIRKKKRSDLEATSVIL